MAEDGAVVVGVQDTAPGPQQREGIDAAPATDEGEGLPREERVEKNRRGDREERHSSSGGLEVVERPLLGPVHRGGNPTTHEIPRRAVGEPSSEGNGYTDPELPAADPDTTPGEAVAPEPGGN